MDCPLTDPTTNHLPFLHAMDGAISKQIATATNVVLLQVTLIGLELDRIIDWPWLVLLIPSWLIWPVTRILSNRRQVQELKHGYPKG